MSRATMFERYDNGKIKKPYVTLDMVISEVMTSMLSDEAIGRVIKGLVEYERSGGEEVPNLERFEQAFLLALIKKQEMCRTAWENKSKVRKKASEAAVEARAELKIMCGGELK